MTDLNSTDYVSDPAPNLPVEPRPVLNFDNLRQKAKDILADKHLDLSTFSRDDLAYLVEEIQIHQVELEIQNEELRQTQLRLSAESERFRQLYDFAPTAYCTINKNQEIQYCNLTFARMVGAAREGILNKLFSDFVAPDYQDQFYFFHKNAIRNKTLTPIGMQICQSLSSSTIDVQLMGTFIEQVDIHPIHSDIGDDESPNPSYLLAITDVSSLKKTESILVNRLSQQKAVSELGRVALSTTELDEFVQQAVSVVRNAMDSHFCTLLKTNEHDQLISIATDGWPALFAPVEVKSHSKYTLKVGRSTIVDDFRSDTRIRSIANRISSKPLSGICVVIFDESKPWGTLCVHDRQLNKFNENDIRFLESIANLICIALERRRLEDILLESQKLKSVGLLAGGVAHDFNNLLTGLLIQNEIALSEIDETHPSRPRLISMSETAQQAAHLTRQLLAYAGQGTFLIQSLNINHLITEYQDLLQATIPSNIKLITGVDNLLPTLKADKGQLQQVLMNLVVNASEAYEESTGIVSIAASQLTGSAFPDNLHLSENPAPHQSYIQISVTDSGKGMSPDLVKRIFDPFFTTKFTGRGLGLAAVKGIVKQLSGVIGIQSTEGDGTTFHIFIPSEDYIVTNDKLDPFGDCPKTTCPAENSHTTILLVDDDIMVRDGTSEYLQMKGFQTIEAENGAEGVDLFKANRDKIDLILLDLTMPVMSGDEAFFHFREINPNIPIIVLSGYGEQEAIRKLKGCDYQFIQKPFSFEAIIELT